MEICKKPQVFAEGIILLSCQKKGDFQEFVSQQLLYIIK